MRVRRIVRRETADVRREAGAVRREVNIVHCHPEEPKATKDLRRIYKENRI